MEQRLRPFVQRHAPRTFCENVVAGHYGEATDAITTAALVLSSH